MYWPKRSIDFVILNKKLQPKNAINLVLEDGTVGFMTYKMLHELLCKTWTG